MQLILVQHGLAALESEDPKRPLTDQGRAEVEKVAHHLARVADELIRSRIAAIQHSGKLRAKQTAEILGQIVAPLAEIRENRELLPGGDPETLAVRITAKADQPHAMVMVGHLPQLAKAASRLLTGRETPLAVRFVNAGPVSLSWDEENGWAVDWIIRPGMLP